MPTVLNIVRGALFFAGADVHEGPVPVERVVDISDRCAFDMGERGARIIFGRVFNKIIVQVDSVGSIESFHFTHVANEKYASEEVEDKFRRAAERLGHTPRGLRELILKYVPKH